MAIVLPVVAVKIICHGHFFANAPVIKTKVEIFGQVLRMAYNDCFVYFICTIIENVKY